ncbi:MAG TPA: hypothetical protein VIJ28_20850 [Chloroflexota bacterium]
MCKQAGVPRIRVYDLRHTTASLMVDAGADLKAASEALRHSDPRITMWETTGTYKATSVPALSLFLRMRSPLRRISRGPAEGDLAKTLQKCPPSDPFRVAAESISPLNTRVGARGFEPPTF